MDLRQVLRTALEHANIDDCDAVLDALEEDSDMFLLLKLAELAGGEQLLKNRVRVPQDVFCLEPALYARHRRYTDDSQLTFPNIEMDPHCEQAQLIPVSSERYSFSEVHASRFENLYRKAQFPTAAKLAQLSKESSLNLAWQCLEAPHADFMKSQAGYIRREVMTSVVEDIVPEDFGERITTYNAVELRYFLEIKRETINLLYSPASTLQKLFDGVEKFTDFAYINQRTVVIDWGKALEYVRDMNDAEYTQYIDGLRGNTVPKPESPARIENELSDNMVNSNSVGLFNSVTDAQNGPEMLEYVREAKAAILEEVANFDDITQDMTVDEKNNIYKLYMDKLEEMNEMEVRLEQEEHENAVEQAEEVEHPDELVNLSSSVHDNVSDVHEVKEDDVDYMQQPRAEADEQPKAHSNSNSNSEPVEEVGDPEEDYDELSDSGEHEQYMKIIANSPNAEKNPLNDLQDAQINSDPVPINEDELHEIADEQPEPDAEPDVRMLTLKNAPDSAYLSYVQISRGRVQAEVPKLPVNAYVDYSACFRAMPLPAASRRGATLAGQIKEKIDKMRSKDYLVSTYNEAPESKTVSSSNLRVYYDPLRTGAVEAPQNLEEEAEVPFAEGETICGRYELLKMCGQATFSNCFSALDLQENRRICLKIIKNDKEFLDEALDEIHLLELIRELDPQERNGVITVRDYFYFREHLLIVFALYGEDLFVHFDRLQQQKRPSDYTLPVIKDIARQVLRAFDFLHRLGICHLDAKPENILHVSSTFGAGDAPDVRVVDLGSSSFIFDKVHEYIQSRSYRCPEIVCGLPYDTRADIWSVGAVLAELLTGRVLFPNHSVATMLARINALISPIPRNFVLSGRASFKYLTGGLIAFEEENGRTATVCAEHGLLEIWLFGEARELSDDCLLFADLIRQMLVVDCTKRPTAEMLLEHPWLVGDFE